MGLQNIKLSLLINGNLRDFADNLDKVNKAHNMVNEISQVGIEPTESELTNDKQ